MVANSSRILSQARNIGLLTLTSSMLGFAREFVIARQFGATHATDSYLVAMAIPTTLYGLVFGSGLNFAVIPRLAHICHSDPDGGRRTFAQFLSATALLGALISVLILLFPAMLIKIFAPGMVSSNLTQEFTRFLSPLFFLLVTAYSLGSFQCARNQTSSWPLIGVTLNATLVLAIVLLGGLFGFRSLIFGSVAGALAALLLQAMLARRAQFSEPWSLPFPGGEALGMLSALVPFALVLGVGGDSGNSYADLFLIRLFGSRLDAGSITLLALGNKLMGLPVLLIGSAIGLALLPAASISFGEDDLSGATERLVQAFGYALLLICPVAVLYLNLSSQVVFAVFRHGAIARMQLIELGKILHAYTGATVGLTLVYVLSSFLGALRRTKSLIGAGILTVILNAWLMAHLVVTQGAVGMANAVSIGSLSNCGMLLFLLTERLGIGTLVRLLRSAFLVSVGGLGMQLAIAGTRGLDLWPSAPVLGSIVLPAAAALIPYAVWVSFQRKRIVWTEIGMDTNRL